MLSVLLNKTFPSFQYNEWLNLRGVQTGIMIKKNPVSSKRTLKGLTIKMEGNDYLTIHLTHNICSYVTDIWLEIFLLIFLSVFYMLGILPPKNHNNNSKNNNSNNNINSKNTENKKNQQKNRTKTIMFYNFLSFLKKKGEHNFISFVENYEISNILTQVYFICWNLFFKINYTHLWNNTHEKTFTSCTK